MAAAQRLPDVPDGRAGSHRLAIGLRVLREMHLPSGCTDRTLPGDRSAATRPRAAPTLRNISARNDVSGRRVGTSSRSG